MLDVSVSFFSPSSDGGGDCIAGCVVPVIGVDTGLLVISGAGPVVET